jgi:glycosyltransferase involved in cell wall biosynthesis
MLANMKIIVVLPAYNAAGTFKRTYDEIPHEIVDDIILVDDASKDATVEMAQSPGNPDGSPRSRRQPENLLNRSVGARS